MGGQYDLAQHFSLAHFKYIDSRNIARPEQLVVSKYTDEAHIFYQLDEENQTSGLIWYAE